MKGFSKQEKGKDDKPEIEGGLSAVAADPKRNITIIFAIIVLSLILIYYLVFKGKGNHVDKTKEIREQTEISKKDLSNIPTVRPPSEADHSLPSLPRLPDPPPLIAPTPPPLPPQEKPHVVLPVKKPELPAPVLPVTPIAPASEANKKKAEDARKRSGIMLSSGGGGGGGSGSADGKKTTETNVSFDYSYNFRPALSSAARNKVTTLGNLAYTLAQGKIIDTVLETSINTDLPGVVRGIVSRDVYAETGKNILIPKGSRLIGSYGSSAKLGQSRLAIIWNRVIRPDGIDMAINAQGVDKLGHSGVDGVLDNKYFETLSNAILLSVINIGIATASQKFTGAQSPNTVTTSTPNATGGSTVTTQTNSSPVDNAVQSAVSSLGSTTGSLMQDSLKILPTITIDQGTIVKVLINQDIVFPADIASGVNLIE